MSNRISQQTLRFGIAACCAIGGQMPAAGASLRIPGLDGPMTFIVDEVLPAGSAQPLDVTVRVPGVTPRPPIKVSDRDALLDERAAVVTGIAWLQAAASGALEVRLHLGADLAGAGWEYRGRVLEPGGTMTLSTGSYTISGTVVSIALHTPADGIP